MHTTIIHTDAHRAKTAQLATSEFSRRSATLSPAELRRIVADILG
jgi:hypothetical protein